MSFSGLIVGLGNPGSQYQGTRHNMGFLTAEALLRTANDVAQLSGAKFRCDLWKFSLGKISLGKNSPASEKQPYEKANFLLATPLTFMNLSGECVQPLAAWHRIPPDRILVIHDELDLPPGRMKLKKGGGNAGHNGLKSITERLGTPDFYRLRLGIGHSPLGHEDTYNWVLGRLSKGEIEIFESMLPTILRVVRYFAFDDIQAATQAANGFSLEKNE